MFVNNVFTGLLFLSAGIQAHSFTNCQSNSPVAVKSLVLTPDQLTAGQNLSISLGLDSKSEYSGVSANLVVKAFGVQLLEQTYAVPTISMGSSDVSVSEAVPSSVPVGLKLDVTVHLVSGGANIACVELEVSTAASSLLRGVDHVSYLYDAWTTHHKKSKSDSESKSFRLNAIKVMENRIAFSEGKVTHKLGLNKFAGMSSEEFKTMKGLTNPKINVPSNKTILKNLESIPSSIDWRSLGKVGKNLDQKQCGSCFSFSALEAVRSLGMIKLNTEYDLSEQEILDCDTVDSACNGGLMNNVFDYVRENGISLDSDYPYKAVQGKCQKKTKAVTISGYENVDTNEMALKTALAMQPVSVAIDATELQSYESGVISKASCTTNLDHGVLAVGYGTFQNKKVWIVLNSWGQSWASYDGFFYLERLDSSSDVGTCGIASMASYPTGISLYNANEEITIM